MKVEDVMQVRVVKVEPGDTLEHAARGMRDANCGSVVVVDAFGRPLAMLTDRDVCLAALQARSRLAEIRVDQAMSRTLHECLPGEDIAEAEQRMALHQVRRLPVVDDAGQLRGILALDDLVREARDRAAWLLPPISPQEVGRMLGDVTRPQVVDRTGREIHR
jgi:CBS domain-containing protein